MKVILQALLATSFMLSVSAMESKAQCNSFDVVSYDSFEHTNVIPEIIPGTTVHNTPQTFSARTGTRSMYLNIKDCNGGLGTCAGDSIYERVVTCCPTQPIRFRWFMETVFTGAISNIRVVLRNGNDSILADVPSTVAPYNVWTEFISPAVTPGTFNVKLTIYTNVDGGGGNDLGIDDMYVERCSNGKTTTAPLCSGITTLDLFSSVSNNTSTTGTWSGPTTLTNGYLGTYTTGVNTPGSYIYTSTPYGTGGVCLPVKDTVVVSNNAGTAPAPSLGNDTSICINTPKVLIAGPNSSTLSYLWSNMATTSNITAYSGSVTSTLYVVTVTAQSGCIGRDSIRINWVSCTGLNEFDRSSEVSLFPNPANSQVTVKLPQDVKGLCDFVLFSSDGKEMIRTQVSSDTSLPLPSLADGIYIWSIRNEDGFIARGRLTIRN